MLFNPTKCGMICIRNKNNLIVDDYCIYNHPVKAVTHAKCLGVTTDKHLSFNQHVNRISHKGNSINTFFAEQHQVLSTEIFYEVMGRLIIYLHSLVTTQMKKYAKSSGGTKKGGLVY